MTIILLQIQTKGFHIINLEKSLHEIKTYFPGIYPEKFFTKNFWSLRKLSEFIQTRFFRSNYIAVNSINIEAQEMH